MKFEMKLKRPWLNILSAAIAVGGLSWGVFAQNVDLPYNSPSTGADGSFVVPRVPGLEAAMGCYDTVRGEIVFFGGYNPSTTLYHNETWTYKNGVWTLKRPANSPAPRGFSQLVWDPIRNEAVLYGGQTAVGGTTTYLGDTWTWNGTNWTQKNPATTPGTRSQHMMSFHGTASQGEVLLFGGLPVNDSAAAHLNDTWGWNGSNWIQKNPNNSPAPRRSGAMNFFPGLNQTILYGGYRSDTGNVYFDDTWIWNGTDWTQANPATKPQGRFQLSMVHDGFQMIMHGGRTSSNNSNWTETWAFNGNTWSRVFNTGGPSNEWYRNDYVMVYCSGEDRVYMVSGKTNAATPGFSQTAYWSRSNNTWTELEGAVYEFDMNGKADGRWNFTDIFVPAGVRIDFINRSSNKPVRWYATQNVVVDGHINLNGDNATSNNSTGNQAKGGPGGYDGGLGATAFNVSGAYTGQPGSGPGGGLSGINAGESGLNAVHLNNYGNAFLQDLSSGSGGGGGASDNDTNGGNGGAGGGAIHLASTRDIIMNGTITARGGEWYSPGGGAGRGGRGSGGGVRLSADRVLGIGSIDVRGGGSSTGDALGRIRIEGFERTLATSTMNSAVPVVSAPTAEFPNLGGAAILQIIQVAGNNVAQPPSGDLTNPDVVFSSTGSVNIRVSGQNVPDNTPISLRITAGASVINLPPAGQTVLMNGGIANFSTVVPAGRGNIQAFAAFTVSGN